MSLEDKNLIETIKNVWDKNRELNKDVNKMKEQVFGLQEKRLKLIAQLAKDGQEYEERNIMEGFYGIFN